MSEEEKLVKLEEEKNGEKEEEEEVSPQESDLIYLYGMKKFQYYLLSFIVVLIIMGGLFIFLPEGIKISRKLGLEYYLLAVLLLLYALLSLGKKASQLDLVKMIGLYMHTITSIYYFLPKIQVSLDYLDLSNTEDFLRLASSILLVLAGYPLIYLLGKLLFKRNITIEEYKERKKKEKEEEEKKQEEEKE